MNIGETVVVAIITLSVAGASYSALNTGVLTDRAEVVADQAGCRAVTQAILGYVAEHVSAPTRIADLKPYVDGDISAYRLAGGVVTGPGCPSDTGGLP
jgi:hypothetical protein